MTPRSKHLVPCLFTLASAILAPLSAAERGPNLLFIIADDCTYLDMEVHGGQAKTPHLNTLAKEGLKFTRCFQTAPMCSPTRHNIYTGLYPAKSGAYPNHTCVYPGTKSIAHYLGDFGYTVHLSGKTHIAPKESFPFVYSGEFRSADPAKPNCYPRIDELFAAAATTEEPKPFCLFACSNEPHTPFTKEQRGNKLRCSCEELVPALWYFAKGPFELASATLGKQR
jgi:N-sulfoglucosamine sulfohydrolase